MRNAVILRMQSDAPGSGLRTWYEFAPIVDGVPRRRPDHMMASAESAARRARQYGFEPGGRVLDCDVATGLIQNPGS